MSIEGSDKIWNSFYMFWQIFVRTCPSPDPFQEQGGSWREPKRLGKPERDNQMCELKISLYLHLIFFTPHLIYIVGVKSRAFKHIYPENENWKKLLEISFAYRTVNIFITSILDLCRIFRNSPQPPLATMTIAMSLGVDIACHVTAKYPSSAKYGRKVGSQVLLPRLPSQVMRKQNVGNTNRCPLTA